jgi:hypothetical protein
MTVGCSDFLRKHFVLPGPWSNHNKPLSDAKQFCEILVSVKHFHPSLTFDSVGKTWTYLPLDYNERRPDSHKNIRLGLKGQTLQATAHNLIAFVNRSTLD